MKEKLMGTLYVGVVQKFLIYFLQMTTYSFVMQRWRK